MRIGITCDLKSSVPPPDVKGTLPDDWQEEYDSPATIEAIANVLRGLGHEVRVLGDGADMLRQLLDDPPDFVFNLAEGHGISRSREARVPAVLEMLGIPHTGSDPLTLAVTLDKGIAKRLVSGSCPALMVPAGAEVVPGEVACGFFHPGFPLIAKPAWEGSSKGIRGTCLVRREEELAAIVESLHRDHRQPVLLEEFIEGEELTVGVIGNASPAAIGIMRVVPLTNDPSKPFLYSLEVKRNWRQLVRYERPAYTPSMTQTIEAAAVEAYRALGCRDVCRLDFRLHPERGLFFLEANPLPGLNPESSDLVLLARLAGWTYEQLIRTIFVERWLARDEAGENMAHVLILYNEPILPAGHPEAESETEVLSTVAHVGEALETFGHRISKLGIGRDPGNFVCQVRETGPDVIFNLFEGIPGESESETCIAALLEWLHIPFTGSPARALTLARDKPLSKLVLKGAGLPVPDSLTVEEMNDARLRLGPGELCSDWTGKPLRWPVIVKLANHDASVGIEQASVVRSADELVRQAASLRERFGGLIMIEEYIAGRELTVGVIEKRTESGLFLSLPVSEFEFQPAEGRWPIVTYDAKWSVTSTEYSLTPYREIAEVSTDISNRLRRLAGDAFGVMGLRDYGRIDFRVREGQPYILEANPNPDLNPAAGLAGVLDAVGMTYRDLANSLVRLALSRVDSITS